MLGSLIRAKAPVFVTDEILYEGSKQETYNEVNWK